MEAGVRSQEKNASVVYEAFDAGLHLSGIVGICRSLEWDNFRYDPDLTRRSLTAPGATAVVAVARDAAEVVGFAQVFGDGVLQAHPGLLAVGEGWRRRGIGRALVQEAFCRTGAERTDLIASEESLGFYRSFEHREQAGFRLYAENHEEED
jgi:ribosomal protein S18 acetylase RimI-like enzyme